MSIVLQAQSKDNFLSSIDYIAERYGIFRLPDEEIPVFKERVLSAFHYPNSEASIGYASAIARAAGSYPRVIGCLSLSDSCIADYDGYNYNTRIDFNSEPDPDSSFKTSDTVSLSLIKECYFEKEIGDIYISENPGYYLNKDISFIFPFTTYSSRIAAIVQPGVNKVFSKNIIVSSIRSNSPYMRVNVGSVNAIKKVGDYAIAANGNLVIFDDKSRTNIEISYAYRYSEVPLVYCPVSVTSLSLIFENHPNLKDNTIEGGAPRQFSKDELELLRMALAGSSNMWKIGQTLPVSLEGPVHGY
jgi:hypothetical protein